MNDLEEIGRKSMELDKEVAANKKTKEEAKKEIQSPESEKNIREKLEYLIMIFSHQWQT